MSVTQLNPPLPLYIINKGEALCHFIIDYSPESHLYWVCFMIETGEIWTLDNTQVRAQKNVSLGRTLDTKNN